MLNKRILFSLAALGALALIAAAAVPALPPRAATALGQMTQIPAAKQAPAAAVAVEPFSGAAAVEIQGPVVETPPSRQWVITIATLVITGVASPVLVGMFKSRAELADKNLNFAWDNASKVQQLLIEAKDENIKTLAQEINTQRSRLTELEIRNDELQSSAIRSEMKCLEYLKRLAAYEPVTEEVPRKRSADN